MQLAIDPGTARTGFALLGSGSDRYRPIHTSVVDAGAVRDEISYMLRYYVINTILIEKPV
jgi:Holliday junction resolvasome RuvABC endonuclease subunit